MEPIKSAYSDIMINDTQGAVTILAYRTGWHFGGHTHLTFEYAYGRDLVRTDYRHVVFHLVALGPGCDQMCTGTKATVLKQVPVGSKKYGFVGGKGAFEKAKQKAKKRGDSPSDLNEVQYQMHPVDNWERNLPANDEWTTEKYRSRSVKVPTSVAKKGHLLCRKLAQGKTEEGLETKKFHKIFRTSGTNCVQFAMQVLNKIDVAPNWVMKFYAATSPPEAIKLGKLNYILEKK